MLKRITMIMIALALAAGAAAWAQDVPEDQGAAVENDAPQQREQYREKLRHRAETMMIFFVADELELDADQEDEFVDAMRDHLKTKSELDEQEIEYKKKIAEQLRDDNADKEELEKTLADLEDVRAKRDEMDDRLKDNLKEILDVEQQAKFEVALPRAREEIVKMIKKAKDMKDKAGGPKGQKGPDMDGKPGPGNASGPGGAPGPKGMKGPKGKFNN